VRDQVGWFEEDEDETFQGSGSLFAVGGKRKRRQSRICALS